VNTVTSQFYPPNSVQIELVKILSRLGGDQDLFGDLVTIYREDYPKLLGEVRNAVGERDGVALQRAGHALKGLIGNFQHDNTTNLALKLEKMGRSGEWNGVDEAFAELEVATELLLKSLEAAVGR
jgi:two-component system, sensor histidine kinase and response regulator